MHAHATHDLQTHLRHLCSQTTTRTTPSRHMTDSEFQPLPSSPPVERIDPDLDGCNPSAANPLPYTNTGDYHADPLRYLQFQHDPVPPPSQGEFLSPDDYPSDASSDTYDTDVPLPEAPPMLDRHPVPPRDQAFNLPRGFLASHPSLQLAERADPQLLPSVPKPLFTSKSPVMGYPITLGPKSQWESIFPCKCGRISSTTILTPKWSCLWNSGGPPPTWVTKCLLSN